MTLVSVIVPCHNYGRYLPDCINSLVGGPTCMGLVQAQTLADFEVIIIDDASTDDSWQIAQKLAHSHARVRALRLATNQGTPTALNTGVEQAKGQYIQILSADDMLEHWTLERLYRGCLDNPHCVAYGDITLVQGGAKVKQWRLPQYSCDLVLHKNPMGAGIMYPRKAWQEAGGYRVEMRWGREDWAFNVALMLAGWWGVHIGDSGYLYRWDGQNRSLRTGNNQRWGTVAQDPTPDGTPTWKEFFRNQLRSLYPGAYDEGAKMPGCCGGGRARPAGKGSPMPKTGGLPGGTGMTKLEYIGANQGNSTWFGPATQTRYVFGASRRIGYVDSRDADGMLAMKGKDGKSPVFRIKAEAPKTVPVPEVLPEPEPPVIMAQPETPKKRGRPKKKVEEDA